MAKAYTFEDLMKRNNKIANTPISDIYGDNGDEAQGEILDVPSQTRAQAAAQASAAAQAAAKALYTGGKYSAPDTLIPGMSYTEWLMKGGMNGQAQKEYDAAVRAAETDYAKTLALYGQNAETLGRAGLTGSGYTDYLTGAGFSAMQGAKVAAADTKALTEAQQRLSYADYLAGVDAQNAQLAAQENAKQEATAANIKSTIDTAIQQGMDDKAIMAMIQQHYGNDFDGYLSGWIANAHTYNDPLVAQNAQSAADAEAAKYREEIFNQLKAGVDPAIVRANIEYVMKFTGADTSQLDTWMAEAQTAAQPTIDANNANNAVAEEDDALREYTDLISGGLDKNTVINQLKRDYSESAVNYAVQTYETSQANIKAEAQNTTADQLFKALEAEGITLEQIGNAAAYNNLALAGEITEDQARRLTAEAAKVRYDILKKDFESFGDMDTVSAQDAMTNWMNTINSLDARDLEDYQRAQLYGMLGDALLSGNIELKKPVSEMLNDIRALDKDKIGEAAYNGVVDAFMNSIDVSTAFKTDRVTYGGTSSYKYAIEIDCGKREDGKEASQQIKFTHYDASAQTQESLNNMGPVPLDGEVRTRNGKLYVYDNGEKKWEMLNVVWSTVAGEENAKIMYDMLVRYYSAGIRNGQDFPSEKHKNAIK